MIWTAIAAAIFAIVGLFSFAMNSPPPWANRLALMLAALIVFLDERRRGLFKRRND